MRKLYSLKTVEYCWDKLKTNKCRSMSFSWSEDVTFLRSVFSKLIYKFNAFPNKIPTDYFVKIGKLMLKFIWKPGSRIDKLVLKMKNKVKRLTLSDFNNYSTATVSKTVWYGHNDIQIDKTGNPEINSDIYWQLMFDKCAKISQFERDIFEQIVLAWFYLCIKIN